MVISHGYVNVYRRVPHHVLRIPSYWDGHDVADFVDSVPSQLGSTRMTARCENVIPQDPEIRFRQKTMLSYPAVHICFTV